MFTGIVEEVGAVESATPSHLTVSASKVVADLKVGDSICINGTCLTATSTTEAGFTADVVPETLRRTNLGSLVAGDPVNLERSMAIGDHNGRWRVGRLGHFDADKRGAHRGANRAQPNESTSCGKGLSEANLV